MKVNHTPSLVATVTAAVRNSEELAYLDYAGTPVTSGAWVQLVAATARDYAGLEIFDSSGYIMEIGLGGAGSEVAEAYILPGGNGEINKVIPAGTRISVRAKSTTASEGEIAINGIYNP